MEITLHSQKTIKEVKKEFSKVYPFLKLEFFKKPHEAGEASHYSEEIPASAQLIDVRGVLREGHIRIHPGDTVKSVEQKFQHEFGLPVQIFRKQNNVWLETTKTDYVSLEEQNEMGRVASEPALFKVTERYTNN